MVRKPAKGARGSEKRGSGRKVFRNGRNEGTHEESSRDCSWQYIEAQRNFGGSQNMSKWSLVAREM